MIKRIATKKFITVNFFVAFFNVWILYLNINAPFPF